MNIYIYIIIIIIIIIIIHSGNLRIPPPCVGTDKHVVGLVCFQTEPPALPRSRCAFYALGQSLLQPASPDLGETWGSQSHSQPAQTWGRLGAVGMVARVHNRASGSLLPRFSVLINPYHSCFQMVSNSLEKNHVATLC